MAAAPSRTRRDFRNDLERWRAQRNDPAQAVIAEQDSWVAEQHHERYVPSPLIDQPIAPAAYDDAADADTGPAPLTSSTASESSVEESDARR